MSDEQDKPTLSRKPLGLKRTVEAGQVQQQFSHGRRNTVVVEVKRRRVLGRPGEAAPEHAATLHLDHHRIAAAVAELLLHLSGLDRPLQPLSLIHI